MRKAVRGIGFALLCFTGLVGGYMFVQDEALRYPPSYTRCLFRVKHEFLKPLADHLRAFKQKHGRYPTNDEGLAVIADRVKDLTKVENFDFAHVSMFISDAGVLSPWTIPYVYENRAGLDPGIFKDSPAAKDTRGDYSVQVDRDVFVYCIGTMALCEWYRPTLARIDLNRIIVFGALPAAIILLLIALLWKRFTVRKMFLHAIALSVSGFVGMFAGSLAPRATCYVISFWAHFNRGSRPELLATYQAQLDKYRKAGVIKEETYNKIKRAVDEDTRKLEMAGWQ